METPHLLIVDDDERLRGLLQKFLRRNGFLVTSACDADHARRLLAGLEFDLMVLDVMMPKEDGITFTRDLRRKISLPILLLTARGETSDRIIGLEAGADDYLAKPFEPKELLLRINAILRRVPPPQAASPEPQAVKHLHFGAARYDLERGELWRDGELQRLTATEAQLLRVLAARAGDVITRGELVDEMSRGPEALQERAVDVQITRLRRKLETDQKQPRFLQTVRGAGYMLTPEG